MRRNALLVASIGKKKKKNCYLAPGIIGLILFSTAVPIWGQTSLFASDLPPKRDCSAERVMHFCWSIAGVV